uniref:SWI/SNF complex subunit SWI3A isoform X2 n=1 Tax=Erigeron canadensis TaxID=72917 RepID=UPI001CB91745|nr:SWI/SNF complex subunit SWI3A isoform X2 [Erigeron canadensis]
MEKNSQFLKPFIPADDHRFQFELYTIPATSDWFSWDNIHEIEKTSLKEFFDASSLTRNPRVYKEYRDFIISKYREDPSRRLTFSEVRKSLVGDVTYLLKVFSFLDKWGLINFGAPKASDADNDGDEDQKWKVKVEDGPPHSMRVVAIPNSLKPVLLPDSVSDKSGFRDVESDFKMPPLSSHSDVYQDLIALVCGSCKGPCKSGHYEYTKDGSSILCSKCFKNGSYGVNKSADDYKFVAHNPENESHVVAWTEAETLLLLESVLKHGDDWDLVAQNVQTKSKLDCISKLIQLPFGQLMLGPSYDRFRKRDTNNITNNQKRVQGGPQATQDAKDIGSQHVELESKSQQNGDIDSEGPPPKRICITPISDSKDHEMELTKDEEEQEEPLVVLSEEIREEDTQDFVLKNHKQQDGEDSQGLEIKNYKQQDGGLEDHGPVKKGYSKPLLNMGNSLMQQIARISAVVGPHVAASAAEAAVTALCDENEIPKEIFDIEEDGKEPERIAQGNGSEMDTRPDKLEKGVIPLQLRMRATSATALGAAAAHAKLLALQEDREVESLVSAVVNTQLKKLQHKMELLKELEAIMEKESAQMVELEESLLTERMDAAQKAIDAGLGRWRDRMIAKSPVETIL